MWFLVWVACAGDPAEGEFSALTYNVHGLPSAIAGDDTEARMAQIGARLGQWTFMALQEDWTPEGHALLVGSVSSEWQASFDAPTVDSVYGAGLTVLLDHVPVDYREVRYTGCHGTLDAGSDCLAAKGFQAMRIDLGGGELDLYNTHLDAGGSAGDIAARDVQVEQMVESLTTWSLGRAVLLLGDTNIDGFEAADADTLRRLMEGGGLQDGCAAVGCAEPGRIDRFLFRGGAGFALEPNAWVVEEAFVDGSGVPLSDHDALSMRFRWRRE